jgi:lauroyl/myristoyl acyltransferase
MGVGRVLLGDGTNEAFSPIPLVHALRQNQFVALLTDRDSASRACPVDFFAGRMAMPTGAAVLAYVTGAPILPVYVVRNGRLGYEAAHEPTIDPADYRHLPRDEAVAAMTRTMAQAFERIIGSHVEEWYNFFPEWMEEEAP